VLTAAAAFAVAGTAAVVLAQRVASAASLAEGLSTARGVGQTLLAPAIPAVLGGDVHAAAGLDAVVAQRRAEGALVRVKVWRRDGTVLWSDDHAIIGRRFALSPRSAAVFDERRDYAEMSALTDPDDADERRDFRNLVEAHVAMDLTDGSTVALEMYFPGAGVHAAQDEASERLVTFSLAILLVLVVAQMPVSMWLMSRTGALQQDRDRLRGTALVSSERERRLLARSLHDGVVQELSGAAYVLESRTPSDAVPADIVQAMDMVTVTLHQAVDDLRGMLVELQPADLTGANLGELVAASATRACPRQRVSVSASLQRPPPPEILAFLHSAARECAINVAKHARASAVDITIAGDADGARLVVQDDGIGIPDPVPQADGHLGLTLLRTTAAELGGSLDARDTGAGTRITILVPYGRPGSG
jgi:two-component system NarL family sensor kinase